MMAEFHTVSQLLHILRVAGPQADKTKPPSVQSWLQADDVGSQLQVWRPWHKTFISFCDGCKIFQKHVYSNSFDSQKCIVLPCFRVSTFGGMEWWNETVEWTTGTVECFIGHT